MPDLIRRTFHVELNANVPPDTTPQDIAHALALRAHGIQSCHVYDSLASLVAQTTESLGGHPCECELPGFFLSGIPGVIGRIEDGAPAVGAVFERCDLCQRFESDAQVERAVAAYFVDHHIFLEPIPEGGDDHAPAAPNL